MQKSRNRYGQQRRERRSIAGFALRVALVAPLAGCASTTPPPPAAQAPSSSAASAATVAPADAPVLSDGRRWTAKFYARETQALWDQFSPRVQGLFKSKSGLDAFCDEVETLGKESKVVEEHVDHQGDVAHYVRTVVYDKRSSRFAVVIGFDSSRHIVKFGVLPAEPTREAPSAYLQYVTHAPLRLPFDGEWSVAWGGRSVAQNRHAVVADQRFAYDFEIERNGSTHKESGKANADYWCFGEPILAPADGKVIEATNDVEDNVPGVMNRDAVPGNYVVIDHGQNEFSFLAHLQKGSVRVKVGDTIAKGAAIGACGNSGNTSQPHLHYHLQNSPLFAKGEGLPAQFRDYTADGKYVAAGEPVRMQLIKNGRP